MASPAITYLIFLHITFLLSQSAQYQVSTSLAFFYIHSPTNIQLCHVLDHSSWPAIPWAFHCESEHGQVLCAWVELVPYSARGSSTGATQLCSAFWSAVQCTPAPSWNSPWAGRAHTCTDNSTITNKVSGDHTILVQVINTTQLKSQVKNLLIVICPTTSLCCEFGHFYLSLSS